jgi:hypothetical protein
MREGFNPELYLRLAGERMLISLPGNLPGAPWQALVEVASTLVAIGALDHDVAGSIVEDYLSALALRNQAGGHPMARQLMLRSMGSPRPSSGPLRPPRVARCKPREVALPPGTITVEYVVLSDRFVAVAVIVPNPRTQGGIGRPGPAQAVRLLDDAGCTEFANLAINGGDRMGRWRGHLITSGPLSILTSWIEIEGTRVDLADGLPLPEVTIEALPPMDPAERYLRSRLTAGRHGPHAGPRPPLIDVTIETLVASGALDATCTAITEVRQVLDAFSGGPGPNIGLPKPWDSLLRPAVGPDTRSATVLLGVVAPPVSGMSIALDALLIRDGFAELHIATNSGSAFVQRAMPTALEGTTIEWWAVDDLGNHYLGAPINWSGQDEAARAVITFWPGVDPAARSLRLLLTGPRERAVLDIALESEEQVP